MCELWEAQVRRQLWHKVWVLLYKLYPFHAGGLYKKTTTYSSSNPGSMRGSLRDTHTDTQTKGQSEHSPGYGGEGWAGWGAVRLWESVDSQSHWLGTLTGPPRGL